MNPAAPVTNTLAIYFPFLQRDVIIESMMVLESKYPAQSLIVIFHKKMGKTWILQQKKQNRSLFLPMEPALATLVLEVGAYCSALATLKKHFLGTLHTPPTTGWKC